MRLAARLQGSAGVAAPRAGGPLSAYLTVSLSTSWDLSYSLEHSLGTTDRAKGNHLPQLLEDRGPQSSWGSGAAGLPVPRNCVPSPWGPSLAWPEAHWT